jgi:hypothetical protein
VAANGTGGAHAVPDKHLQQDQQAGHGGTADDAAHGTQSGSDGAADCGGAQPVEKRQRRLSGRH